MKRLFSFNPKFYYTFLSDNSKAPGQLYLQKFSNILQKDDPKVYTITMNCPGLETKRKFFISDHFTFKNLKDLLAIEFPQSDVNIEAEPSLNLNSKIVQTMESPNSEFHIKFKIDDAELIMQNYVLHSLKRISPLVEEDQFSVVNLQTSLNKSGLSVSNSRVISKYIQILRSNLEGKPLNNENLSKVQNDSIYFFGENYSKGKERVMDKINELEAELKNLEEENGLLEEMITGKMTLYLYLLSGVSVIQIISFYYMIFHIEWLGWDIIEPITYSITQISLLLMLRFVWKYRRNREFASLKDIYFQRKLEKNHEMKKIYNFTKERMEELERKLEVNQNLLKVLKNRRNYYRSLETMND